MPGPPYRSTLDGDALHAYIAAHPDATLEEIGGAFAVYPSTIYYACRRLKITRKKTLLFKERRTPERQIFLAKLRDLVDLDVVYVDESGVDETIHREHARSPRGQTVSAEISGTHAQRLSLLAAYAQHAFLASMRFEGYTDTEVFNTWVEHCFVPTLTPG